MDWTCSKEQLPCAPLKKIFNSNSVHQGQVSSKIETSLGANSEIMRPSVETRKNEAEALTNVYSFYMIKYFVYFSKLNVFLQNPFIGHLNAILSTSLCLPWSKLSYLP